MGFFTEWYVLSSCALGTLLRFAPGERVTQLTVFPGPDNSGTRSARAGALTFATSAVRVSWPIMLVKAKAVWKQCGDAAALGFEHGAGMPRQLQGAQPKREVWLGCRAESSILAISSRAQGALQRMSPAASPAVWPCAEVGPSA